MKWQRFPKSPVFPQGHPWEIKKRADGYYESDLTALVRGMMENDAMREDRATAWERWRNDETQLRNKAS